MSETVNEVPVAEATLINHYCFVCGALCVRGEWEGMTGWQCTDPDCGIFEFD